MCVNYFVYYINVDDPVARPQSEFKVSTPIDKPSAPLSAPPNVIEQARMEGNIDILFCIIRKSLFLSILSFITAWKNEKPDDTVPVKEPPHPTVISALPYDKPVPGSTLRRLDDPDFDVDVTSSSITSKGPAATDDLNEARDRFDRFWDCNKDKNAKI